MAATARHSPAGRLRSGSQLPSPLLRCGGHCAATAPSVVLPRTLAVRCPTVGRAHRRWPCARRRARRVSGQSAAGTPGTCPSRTCLFWRRVSARILSRLLLCTPLYSSVGRLASDVAVVWRPTLGTFGVRRWPLNAGRLASGVGFEAQEVFRGRRVACTVPRATLGVDEDLSGQQRSDGPADGPGVRFAGTGGFEVVLVGCRLTPEGFDRDRLVALPEPGLLVVIDGLDSHVCEYPHRPVGQASAQRVSPRDVPGTHRAVTLYPWCPAWLPAAGSAHPSYPGSDRAPWSGAGL